MPPYDYATMRVCKYASMKVCRCAIMQVYGFTDIEVSAIQVQKHANLLSQEETQSTFLISAFPYPFLLVAFVCLLAHFVYIHS